MAQLLQRLGLGVARHKTGVIVVWLLVLVGVGTAAVTLSGPTVQSFSIPSAESSQALTTVGQKFPESNISGASAQAVMTAPAGTTFLDPANEAVVAKTVAALKPVAGVASVQDPFANPDLPIVSPDGSTTFITVTFAATQGNVEQTSLDAVQQAVDAAKAAGIDVKIGGNAFQGVPEVLGVGEVGGVVVAFLVLMLTYGALAAAGANLLTAAIGVGIGAAGITALTGVMDLQTSTPILAVMLGLAVGIDYALFIMARFRSERMAGRSVHDAVGIAVGTAGSAVVVAGLTVVIALVGLTVVGIPFMGEMGVAAAGTVVLAVLVALTLLPAVIAAFGDKLIRKKYRAAVHAGEAIPAPAEATTEDGKKRGFQAGWANLVTRHGKLTGLIGVVVLAVISVPLFSMTTALPDSSTADPASQQRQAYDVLTAKFGPGISAPLVLLIETTPGNAQAAAGAVVGQLNGTPDVLQAQPQAVSKDGSAALVAVVPTSGPHDDATSELVNRLRDTDFGAGVDVKVTGTTAVGIDVQTTLNGALPRYLGIVVGLALILLLLVFRSILVPVTATIGFLLSFGTALGATVAVFQWGWLGSLFGVTQSAPLLSLMPILVVGILFGLAMDYQVFLVSRIHEAHTHGAEPIEAIRAGFRRSAPVVIAAATIMAAVFGGFVFSNNEIIKPIAFALTVGVLADAFIVRMIIIPSVLSVLGRAAWWLPKWLARVLPHLDVEGSTIEKGSPATAVSSGSPATRHGQIDPEVAAAIDAAADTATEHGRHEAPSGS